MEAAVDPWLMLLRLLEAFSKSMWYLQEISLDWWIPDSEYFWNTSLGCMLGCRLIPLIL